MSGTYWKPITGLQVAIDGPSGSGKGTISQRLGEALQLAVLDTGLLYRFTAWLGAKHDVLLDEDALLPVLEAHIGELSWNADGLQFPHLDRAELRCEAISQQASVVAAYPKIRESLLQRQRELAQKGCIMDGRDIGTVVLVDAQAKFFLTASAEERARRRWLQLQAVNGEVRFETVLTELKNRDERDSARGCSPLVQAQDAVHVDTTNVGIDDVVQNMLNILQRKQLIIM